MKQQYLSTTCDIRVRHRSSLAPCRLDTGVGLTRLASPGLGDSWRHDVHGTELSVEVDWSGCGSLKGSRCAKRTLTRRHGFYESSPFAMCCLCSSTAGRLCRLHPRASRGRRKLESVIPTAQQAGSRQRRPAHILAAHPAAGPIRGPSAVVAPVARARQAPTAGRRLHPQAHVPPA